MNIPFDVVVFMREHFGTSLDGLQVRVAGPADKDAFQGLSERMEAEHRVPPDSQPNPVFEQWVNAAFQGENGVAVMIEDGSGTLVGTAGILIAPLQLEGSDGDHTCGWLFGLALDPSVRKRGLASCLTDAMLIFGMSRGITMFLVETLNPQVCTMLKNRRFQEMRFPGADAASPVKTLGANPEHVGQALQEKHPGLLLIVVERDE